MRRFRAYLVVGAVALAAIAAAVVLAALALTSGEIQRTAATEPRVAF